MKVYLLWDDGDYYGPDPEGGFVYASRVAAEKGLEKSLAGRSYRKDQTNGVWKDSDVTGRWEYSNGAYYIEEMDVVE